MKKPTISVKLKREHYDKLRAFGKRSGITITWLVNRSVKEYIEREVKP